MSSTAVEISVKSGNSNDVDRVSKVAHSNGRRGNYTAVIHSNRVIFSHVNTPLFGFVWQNGQSGIDIVPVLAKDPGEILNANPHNPFIRKGMKLTGEVS
jgi:hypothetical protein